MARGHLDKQIQRIGVVVHAIAGEYEALQASQGKVLGYVSNSSPTSIIREVVPGDL